MGTETWTRRDGGKTDEQKTLSALVPWCLRVPSPVFGIAMRPSQDSRALPSPAPNAVVTHPNLAGKTRVAVLCPEVSPKAQDSGSDEQPPHKSGDILKNPFSVMVLPPLNFSGRSRGIQRWGDPMWVMGLGIVGNEIGLELMLAWGVRGAATGFQGRAGTCGWGLLEPGATRRMRL